MELLLVVEELGDAENAPTRDTVDVADAFVSNASLEDPTVTVPAAAPGVNAISIMSPADIVSVDDVSKNWPVVDAPMDRVLFAFAPLMRKTTVLVPPDTEFECMLMFNPDSVPGVLNRALALSSTLFNVVLGEEPIGGIYAVVLAVDEPNAVLLLTKNVFAIVIIEEAVRLYLDRTCYPKTAVCCFFDLLIVLHLLLRLIKLYLVLCQTMSKIHLFHF